VELELRTMTLVSPHALELDGVLEPAGADYDLHYSGTLTAGGDDGR